MALGVVAPRPEWLDDADTSARAAGVDRCFSPRGSGARIMPESRPLADAFREVHVPTLVMHGSRNVIDPSGGRRTAELIPGARYVEIEGMGHDYPPAMWDHVGWTPGWSSPPPFPSDDQLGSQVTATTLWTVRRARSPTQKEQDVGPPARHGAEDVHLSSGLGRGTYDVW